MHDPTQVAALSIAIAFIAGVVCQGIARHLRVPGIVLLLGAGVLLGPHLANIVRPQSLGHALHVVVGFAVSVILFEGALSLNLKRLRQQARPIRRLVTFGGIITAVGGMLAARLLLGWDWRTSGLFGTLVMVTGPTVINPLLRRIRVTRNLQSVLEAEGILIDAIGAVIAVVALEVALAPREHLATGVTGFGLRWASGLAVGAISGGVTALLLRLPRVVPEGLSNIFTLAMVLATFQVSNALAAESGVIAVIAQGLVLGNLPGVERRELADFKEQLTTLLLGMLFVLLAADVSLQEVAALGWPGVLTVLALMVVVRPVAVLLSTARSTLTWRERLFMCWMGPRGIVAAAVASLFAVRLAEAGVAGGSEVRALVFLVIGVTVVIQGLGGEYVARALGVQRKSERGYVLLGAGALSRLLGKRLKEAGHPVLLVDTNASACRAAEEEELRVIYGNGLAETTLLRTEPDGRDGYIGATTNEGVNMLFVQRAREERVLNVYVALHRGRIGVNEKSVEETGGGILFGGPQHLDLWNTRAERKLLAVERWVFRGPSGVGAPAEAKPVPDGDTLLPLVHQRDGRAVPWSHKLKLRSGDAVEWAFLAEQADAAREQLRKVGWEPARGA